VGEVLEYEISFAILDEIIEIVDDMFMLHFLVELVLSLLLLTILTHLYGNQSIGEDVLCLKDFT
jgi:hypothetical protein